MKGLSIIGLMVILLLACTKSEVDFGDGRGMKPIYLSSKQWRTVGNMPQKEVKNSGPIVLKDTLFFMVENNQGVHVYNIKDSVNVKYLTFLVIPAISNFTIRGDRMYCRSWTDLVTIDISDLMKISEVNRKEDEFEPVLTPPFYQGIFECVQPEKGAVVNWIEVSLKNADCETI